MIDPSHTTGFSEFVTLMAMAAIAAGTDSLIIEVHPNPAKPLFDGLPFLTVEAFEQLMLKLVLLVKFFGL